MGNKMTSCISTFHTSERQNNDLIFDFTKKE